VCFNLDTLAEELAWYHYILYTILNFHLRDTGSGERYTCTENGDVSQLTRGVFAVTGSLVVESSYFYHISPPAFDSYLFCLPAAIDVLSERLASRRHRETNRKLRGCGEIVPKPRKLVEVRCGEGVRQPSLPQQTQQDTYLETIYLQNTAREFR